MERSKREDIVQQAFRVFYRDGFHASGMESLLEGTGISKRTLYRYFVSKEALVEATVRYYTERLLAAWNSQEARGLTRVMLPFDWLAQAADEGRGRGCFALNAKLEYAARNAEIETACADFFAEIEAYFETALKDLGFSRARIRARQIAILFRGVIVTRQTEEGSSCIQAAKAAVRELLKDRPS